MLLSDSMNSSSVLLADLHCYGESLELHLKSVFHINQFITIN